MVDRRLSPRNFDRDAELVSTRHQPINGVAHAPGDPLDEELSPTIRLRMWMCGRAVYAKDYRPTPHAMPAAKADAAAAATEQAAEASTETEVEEVERKATQDDDGVWHLGGFTMTEGKGGWHSIEGPGIGPGDREKEQGADKAHARLEELAAAHEAEANENGDGEAAEAGANEEE